MTVLDKNIQVEEFIVFDFFESSLDLWDIKFEYLGDQIVDCVFLDTKVQSELKFGHLVNLNSSDNTNNLKKPCFVFFYRFFNTEYPINDSTFDIFLDLFKEFWEKVTVFIACF